ncbi:hypothetical protein AAKU55_005655 [Oxalobacteraceae bacterium GrIS 1.11]
MKHTLEHIRSLKEMLAKLPAVENQVTELTTVEAMKLLRPEVMALQRKAYSFEMIAKTLDQHDFAVTAATLKKYCRAGKPVARRKRMKQHPAEIEGAQGPNSRVAANALRKPARVDPDARKTGGFAPLEDTKDI